MIRLFQIAIALVIGFLLAPNSHKQLTDSASTIERALAGEAVDDDWGIDTPR